MLAALVRYWLIVFPLAHREVRRWRRHALQISDPQLRNDALQTLDDEHLNAEGAALVTAAAPWRYTRTLVTATVAYQVLYDYLDTITERNSSPDRTRRLHGALHDAVTDPGAGRWRHARSDADGDYLQALVDACAAAVRRLPALSLVGPGLFLAAARSAEVQAIAHDPAGHQREQLAAWAARQPSGTMHLLWWESAAAASSTLSTHLLLSRAADRHMTPAVVDVVERYALAVSALNTLLESRVDARADALVDAHSYAAYYPTTTIATARLTTIARTARETAAALPRGDRYQLICAGMTAFYLSDGTAWNDPLDATAARDIATAAGASTTLIRMLRARRRAS